MVFKISLFLWGAWENSTTRIFSLKEEDQLLCIHTAYVTLNMNTDVSQSVKTKLKYFFV